MSDRWESNIHRFSRKIGVNANLVVKKLAIELFKLIVLKTPVDTGRARASWNISAGVIDTSVMPPGEYAKNEALAKAKESALGGMARVIWITNSLPYILALEHGHSSQAPAGMVGLSVEEIENYLETVIREAGL